MIVWFNCKITDVRLNPTFNVRYNLRSDSRFDIAKYSFASYAPLEPLTSKFIFNLQMADGFAGREPEMEAWLKSIFPADKLELHWNRLDSIQEWRDFYTDISTNPDELIFVTGNEDHIFMDSNIDMFELGLKEIANDPRHEAVMATSHFPEAIRASYYFNGIYYNHYVSFPFDCNDGMRVMKKDFLNRYINTFRDENALVFRTEDWNRYGTLHNIIYTPTKEQFIHYDGYSHVKIGPDVSPPLEIPPRFFEGDMVIRYGFNDRDPDCVNINPLSPTLYAADKNGADYKFTLEDIPAFWLPRVKEIIVADDVDHYVMAAARNQHYLNKSKVPINWSHAGIMFNHFNEPPSSWFDNHQLITDPSLVDNSETIL